MATLFITSNSPPRIQSPFSRPSCRNKITNRTFPYTVVSCSDQYVLRFRKHPFGQKSGKTLQLSVSTSRKSFKCSAKEERESSDQTSSSSSSAAVVEDKPSDKGEEGKASDEGSVQEVETREKEAEELEKQLEIDWKTDEEFKKFMGNPSIEAAIKLEKKRADRKLKELDRESSDNPIVGLFNRLVRDSLAREKERLEKAEEAFKALDLNKVITFLP